LASFGEPLTDGPFTHAEAIWRWVQPCWASVQARPLTRGAWLFQELLNLITGNGEKPARAYIAYVSLITVFAVVYWVLWHFGLTAENLSSPDSPLELSLTAFHGRSFFAGGLNITDWGARVGAIESAIGLFIEIIFIATFSRRFLWG
jgi:hypothetical protein